MVSILPFHILPTTKPSQISNILLLCHEVSDDELLVFVEAELEEVVVDGDAAASTRMNNTIHYKIIPTPTL